MKNKEDIVWNAITDSAKSKFDYSSFEEQFKEIDEDLADNILFTIIIGLASKKTKELISHELFNQIMMMGLHWKLEDIKSFIADKDKLFSSEIFSSTIAYSLLEEGNDPYVVLNSINQLLN